MSINFSCCFYPTTVVCVDDDVHLLKWMGLLLESRFKVTAFHNPTEFVEFVQKAASAHHHGVGEVHLDTEIALLHQRIYNSKRAEEISALVVDYYMPGMDGLTACKMLKGVAAKKIMLTGEADQSLAVSAFNEGIIDQFVMKGQAQVMEDLQVQIERMQALFFIEKSRFLTEHLLQHFAAVFSYFTDVELQEKLNKLLHEKAIREIYLFNEEGDFLLIDEAKKLWWMSVKTPTMVKRLLQDAEGEFLQEPSPEAEAVFECIKKQEKLPIFAASKTVLDIAEWGPLLATPLAVQTTKDQYQILLLEDFGQANLRYSDIQFV